MSKYVNFDHILAFLAEARRGTRINNSPYMDNALLNLQQILQLDIHNPCLFHYIEVGGCDDCRWRNRPQKCSCCRRNLRIKDCYEKEATMSMTREEAIKLLKQYQGYDPMFPDGETLKHAFDLTDETVDTLLAALRPVSREQVEKVWRGEWKGVPKLGVYDMACSKCGYSPGIRFYSANFCPHCGAPMTDEAVQMVMERLEALNEM